MIKRLSMVRRADGVATGDFGARWRRDVESALDSMPDVARPARLAHCVVRPARIEPPWDGVGIYWFDAEATMRTHDTWMADQGRGDSAIDPSATALVPVEERTVRGQDWLDRIWAGPGGESRLVLIALIEAAPGLSWTQFRDYWWDKHRPFANSIVPLEMETAAYVHNYAIDAETFPWTGIGEMYEESLESARQRGAWMGSEVAAPLLEDEKRFMNQAGRRVLVTDQEIIVN